MILLLVRSYQDRNGPRTREELLNIVRNTQGLTKTELTRRSGLARGTVHYHLRVMLAERHLVRKRNYGWNRIYTPEAVGQGLQLMPLLRQAIVPLMLERLRLSPGLGIQALSAQIGISRKIVRRHLMQLVEAGALECTSNYRPSFYLKGDRPLETNSMDLLNRSPLPHGVENHEICPAGQPAPPIVP